MQLSQGLLAELKAAKLKKTDNRNYGERDSFRTWKPTNGVVRQETVQREEMFTKSKCNRAF